jgi:hypothetical protein
MTVAPSPGTNSRESLHSHLYLILPSCSRVDRRGGGCCVVVEIGGGCGVGGNRVGCCAGGGCGNRVGDDRGGAGCAGCTGCVRIGIAGAAFRRFRGRSFGEGRFGYRAW